MSTSCEPAGELRRMSVRLDDSPAPATADAPQLEKGATHDQPRDQPPAGDQPADQPPAGRRLRRRRRGRDVADVHDRAPDEKLLAAVYEQHGPAVTACAVRLLSDREAAADVTQETFLRAWQNPQILVQGPSEVRAWLLRVTRNLVVDLWRARAVRPQEVSDLAVEAGMVGVTADHADRVADAVSAGKALATLSDEHRRVLELVIFHERTTAEAGAELGIPAGTVKSRTHYALAAISKAFTTKRGEQP